ncbi:PSP1 C terminal conserved region [Trypanosoma vivax]|uniref:PSP1 C-terminal domain-containing protein n=1 Tax=Trypanosoma vivax (strain Y486) TaxID=1055687 RepID=G0U2S6_TRYVY|nr:hypothetical protein TRVL_08075 [Trypanosoma vivax]KAH8604080.1 PSP1 C terminal conserved region [Trypanosoma vivax]CCC50580.1 conserved hypothetical protein [Trypanosoma vivax Y486]
MVVAVDCLVRPRGVAPRQGHRYCHNPYAVCVLDPTPAPNKAVTLRVVAPPPAVVTCIPLPSTSPTPVHVTVSVRETSRSAAKNATEHIDPVEPCTNTPIFYTLVVSFKYGMDAFEAPFPVEVGVAVVTEGDRGEDMGFVQCVHQHTCRPVHAVGRLLRIASPYDIQRHDALVQKEEEALRKMRVLAKQVKCTAFIKDAMYQLDGRKVTFIIARSARSYVDFRRLQRAAFDVFRCRVWLAYLDEIEKPQTVLEQKGH